MSSETRLFVGNLSKDTNEEVLRDAFAKYGQVSNVDVKSKTDGNELKKFAFVSLSGTNYNIESCIKHFSTESFNGNHLHVTRARESFLERLQRERQQAQQKDVNKSEFTEKLPTTNPVIKLGDQLNPRKRKQDVKSLSNESNQTNHKKPYSNSFENTNNSQWLAQHSNRHNQEEKPLTAKDKKKQDSDKKRMESMTKKRQEFKQKQIIIKTGLNGIDNISNKKIVFSDAEEDNNYSTNSHTEKNNKKNTLFDDDEAESDEDVNFEIKEQYEGKQGQKVLDLQSQYKSDKRFILNEKFLDDDDEERSGKQENIEEHDDEIAVGQIDEKVKQLNILQDVLGVAIKSHITQANEKKDKKKTKLGMLRFDPTQPGHAKFLASVENNNQESQKKSTKKKAKEKQMEEAKLEKVEQEENKIEVSKEQFYTVSETLKEAIAQPTTFSLRSLFTKNDDNEKEPQEQGVSYISLEKPKEKKVKNPLDPGERNPFVYDSSDSEDDIQDKHVTAESTPVVSDVKNVWKENLFFTKLDNRLKEGLDFFNKSTENEGQKERRELKSLMKKRIYNKDRKNQMFQKKIGGRKKTLKKSYRKKS